MMIRGGSLSGLNFPECQTNFRKATLFKVIEMEFDVLVEVGIGFYT